MTSKKKAEAQEVTAELVRELLSYDAGTGVFTWLVQRGRQRAGMLAGAFREDGYLQIGISGSIYYGHRLAWLYAHGRWPADQIDHIDGNPKNNRLANLRECNTAENSQNLGLRKNNTSGATGVYWDSARSKWKAQIRQDGHIKALGRFDSFEEAVNSFASAKANAHKFQPIQRGA